MKTGVFAIFDVGKTNKKLLLFDEFLQPLEEHSQSIPETLDEDGFACEDLPQLSSWLLKHWSKLQQRSELVLKGVNFSAYGASLVHLDAQGKPLGPLYNYLKPCPQSVQDGFYAEIEAFEGQNMATFAACTCSPTMGMLNSGLQLYWLAKQRPDFFKHIHTSLHLPQYLSYLLSGEKFSDYTSLGCHTALWDFQKASYHPWIKRSGILPKLAPLIKDPIATVREGVMIGVGLHDSSAALLPYFLQQQEPFILLSTGTWCINLNPFNTEALSTVELQADCLAYLTPKGNPVKASRVFLGREHEYQVERIAKYYHVDQNFYKKLSGKESVKIQTGFIPACMQGTGPIPGLSNGAWDFTPCPDVSSAYFSLMRGLMDILKQSISLIDNGVGQFFVDGGFAHNPVFRQMLASDFPQKRIEVLEFNQATALGALLHLKNGQAEGKSLSIFL